MGIPGIQEVALVHAGEAPLVFRTGNQSAIWKKVIAQKMHMKQKLQSNSPHYLFRK